MYIIIYLVDEDILHYTNLLFRTFRFYLQIICKVHMDNIRNELLAEIQQLKNNQDLQKEMDKQSKSKEVNKVINIKLNNHTWTFNRKHFSYKKEPNEKNNFQKIATAAKKMILNSTVHGVARISIHRRRMRGFSLVKQRYLSNTQLNKDIFVIPGIHLLSMKFNFF